MADLGGWDVERAAAKGTGQGQQDRLEHTWRNICGHFGADAEPRVAYSSAKVRGYVLARRGAGDLGQTIKRDLYALRRAEKEAKRRGAVLMLMDDHDWPEVEADPPGVARKGRLHPPAVLAAWLEHLHQDARDQVELALLTGLREGDLLRVVADWIEPAGEGWGVEAVLRMPPQGKHKRRELIVPLVPRALDVLKRRTAMTPPGTPLVPQGDYRKVWAAARKAIGYQTPISLRDLRHTWATLAGRNIGPDAARDGLGHANISTTNRYLTGDVARIAAASHALAMQLGPGKTGTPTGTPGAGKGSEAMQVFDLMERVKGFEPSTLGLGSRPEDFASALNHVTTCKRCFDRVLACASLHVIEGETGTVNRDTSSAGGGRR